ncbi:NAD(P)-binding protein [Aspergillus japonicus CBS 114.51]|uniref:NAD(P)-binding protein n=1 Tax=Aspergillus japonicus CBS 114.51 TaxID=1448312 RepID=A0A8T8X061_ASPJA|nr:NAD(P)-binding protein [Aspergillus japonicus CBS 114.51]RAH81421.1 NAD(P)-binding protein [Aspergillus japonicus CBS 114.51]
MTTTKLTWLITGCSSGFGFSLARAAQAGGHRIITELERRGDPIDVLVNNAGYCVYAPIETFAEEEVRAQMEAIYFGPLRLIRAVLPHMRQRKSGVIVNMSSGASLDGTPSHGSVRGRKGGIGWYVLAEVAPFNIRTLTVFFLLGDYNGTVVEQVQRLLIDGKPKPNGDKDKAMQALYEVVVGEGVGKGHQNEKLLPLGSDMTPRVTGVQDYLGHALEVFGSVINSVGADGE